MVSQSKLLIWVFLIPALFLYSLFVVYPIFSTLWTSFFNWGGIGEKDWTGLSNYTQLFSDENFINALINTGKYMLFQIPVIVILSLVFSMIIANSANSKKMRFYRSSIFLPYVIPGVAVAMLWAAVLNPITGLLNISLEAIGLDFLAHEWLADSSTAFASIIWVKTWHSIGFYTVLILAALLNIPKEILEAAEVDGANRIQRSIYIMIPMLKNVLQVVVVFVLINALKIFEEPQLMTGGGPNRATEPISLYIYEQAFGNYKFGYASAAGFVFFVITFILTLLTLRVMRGRNNE